MNPLTVLLAVSAWERFVVDARAVAMDLWTEPGQFGKPSDKLPRSVAWLGNRGNPAAPGHATKLFSTLSGGRLPGAWHVRTFTGWSGKSPQARRDLDGDDPAALAEEADAAVMLRNAIAHRAMAQDRNAEAGPYRESDAENSHTVQAGWARTVLAFFLQLTDQAIVAVATEAGYNAEQYRLPEKWFTADPPKLRGVDKPGALWGGYELLRK